jgi:hypothetical protein
VSTTYLARVAVDEMDRAQAVIDQHLVACGLCGGNRLCDPRREAELVFARYGRLPRRRPGAVGATVFALSGGGWR